MNLRDRHLWLVISAGLALGGLGALLAVWGNPENSGICVSCFLENSAGALGLHDNERMRYLRPELIGFVLGALASSLLFREFRSRGGSDPLPRFFGGIFLMVGCAVFIGCPIKLFLRLGAGDLTALSGFAGLFVGVWGGLRTMIEEVRLAPAQPRRGSGLLIPVLFLLLLIFLLTGPGFLLASAGGSATAHAPRSVSLAVGLLLGGLAQRSRLCVTGALRDALLLGRRSPLLYGLLAFALSAVLVNLLSGGFRLGFYGQPGAHTDQLWSFFGMALVGWLSVLIGGCPFRQLIKAGEGDADAGLVVLGMFVGGAVAQSWGLTATAAGVPFYGKVAVLCGFVFVFAWSLFSRVDKTC